MKDITLTIDDKIHKLMRGLEVCDKCSLYYFCEKLEVSVPCPAVGLGGDYFVKLEIEK